MNQDDFLRDVVERTGMPEEGAARAISCAMQALGEGLTELPAARIRERLPPSLRRFIPSHAYGRSLTEESFFLRVAELEGVSLGMAVEHAEVVLQAVYRALDPEVLRLLREDLPERLLEIASARPSYRPPVPRPIPAPTSRRRASSGTSLAEGRVGSTRPVSEAGMERVGSPERLESASLPGDEED